MRNFITIAESLSFDFDEDDQLNEAVNLPAWKRWWGNFNTGEIFEVPANMEHDQYVENHLEDFLSRFTIDDILGDGSEFYDKNHEILNAIYDLGWEAILYETRARTLMLRYNTERQNAKNIGRKLISKIADEYQIDTVYIDLLKNTTTVKHYVLSGRDLEFFLKTGNLRG